MNIAVCLKQVPDAADLSIDPETHTLVREGVAAVLNPLDEFPLEAGLRLAERNGGTVTALTMGPPSAAGVIRKAIAMGADDGLLICDRAFAGADTWATSLTLAKAIEKYGPFDLVLCGKQAVDGDTGQVGPGIAAHLKLPQVTSVTGIDWQAGSGKLVVERLLDEQTARLEVSLPAVLTVLKECNEPRLPNLERRIASLETSIEVVTLEALPLAAGDVGLRGSPTRVVRMCTPQCAREVKRLRGTPDEIADQLLDFLEVSC